MGHAQSTRLLLIRHGETDWNRAARIQGHTDIGLNRRGLAQAAALTAALAEVEIDAVYSSDLLRARQTAGPLAQQRGLPLRLDPGLRERHFGTFEGSSFEQLQALHPQACQRWRSRDPQFAPPQGERLDHFDQRVTAAVLAIAAAHPGQCLALVSHGGALDCLYRCATAQPLHAPRSWELRNAAINRVLVSGGGMTLVGWNDVAHLEGELDEAGC